MIVKYIVQRHSHGRGLTYYSPSDVLDDKAFITLPDTHSIRRADTLTAPLIALAHEHIMRCATRGIYIRITHGLRTWEEQNQLYALGRTRPGKRVTNARGGYSWHNFGCAYDVVILEWNTETNRYVANWNTRDPRWKLVGALGKDLGLIWGGDFKSIVDYPHFEYHPQYTSLADARKQYKETLA